MSFVSCFTSVTQVLKHLLSMASSQVEEMIREACHLQSKSLNLSHCDLTVVPVDLCKALSLTRLQLNNNCLVMPPEEIGDLVNLHELSLDHNRLTVLPTTLFELHRLTVLNISHNPLGLVLWFSWI